MIKSQASMVSKLVESLEAAVAGIEDGAVIMIGGFGAAGMPSELIDALIAQGARDPVQRPPLGVERQEIDG